MATASNSPPASTKSQNSPRSSHFRLSPKAGGISSLPEFSPPPPPPSLSGNADQELYVVSSFSIPSDSFPTGDVRTANYVAEDGSVISGVDLLPELSENGATTKKQAWNKPSNCAIAEVGAVMGADSWPALSKSARASPKFSSSDSFKALSHGSGSPTLSQGMSIGSVSSPKGFNPSILPSNSISTHATPTRQRSMKRGGNGSNHSSMLSNGSLSQAPPMHDFVIEGSTSSQGKSSSSFGEAPRDNMHKDSGQRGSHVGNESHQQRSFKRSNSGPHSRGDGSLLHGHGRRDQERGKHDWNSSHRTFGSRDGLLTPQIVGSRPFIRGPIANTPFITPPPLAVPSFVPPMVYNEMPSPVFYTSGLPPDPVRYMPMFPFAPVFFPLQDLNLPFKIVSQIDYYFSNENLVKDTFLRQNMDGDGWVPINLIAMFKKMTELTDNIQLILEAVQTSNVVEVQGDKVRRKSDWNKWIMPPAMYSPGTSPQPYKSDQNILASHMENVSLDEKAAI